MTDPRRGAAPVNGHPRVTRPTPVRLAALASDGAGWSSVAAARREAPTGRNVRRASRMDARGSTTSWSHGRLHPDGVSDETWTWDGEASARRTRAGPTARGASLRDPRWLLDDAGARRRCCCTATTKAATQYERHLGVGRRRTGRGSRPTGRHRCAGRRSSSSDPEAGSPVALRRAPGRRRGRAGRGRRHVGLGPGRPLAAGAARANQPRDRSSVRTASRTSPSALLLVGGADAASEETGQAWAWSAATWRGPVGADVVRRARPSALASTTSGEVVVLSRRRRRARQHRAATRTSVGERVRRPRLTPARGCRRAT